MTETIGDALEKARADAQAGFRALKARAPRASEDAIGIVLRSARSHYAWTDKPVSREMLEQIHDITQSGPTSMNTCPARFVFVTSDEGKERVKKSLKPTNVEKVVKAPVTTIIAYDTEFWQQLPFLFPHQDLSLIHI